MVVVAFFLQGIEKFKDKERVLGGHNVPCRGSVDKAGKDSGGQRRI